MTLSYRGNGTAPTANPVNSSGWSSGKYYAITVITLTAHPASGYHLDHWGSTVNTNSSNKFAIRIIERPVRSKYVPVGRVFWRPVPALLAAPLPMAPRGGNQARIIAPSSKAIPWINPVMTLMPNMALAGWAGGGTCSMTPSTTLSGGAYRWWVQNKLLHLGA